MDEASVHATSLQLYIQSSEFNVTHYFVSMISTPGTVSCAEIYRPLSRCSFFVFFSIKAFNVSKILSMDHYMAIEIEKEYHNNNLIEKIRRGLDRGNYPIFVTTSNGKEKLQHIRHNRYLSYCLDRFS